MPLTLDPTDPELGHSIDEEPRGQDKKYLVLSPEERAKGFVRPVRRSYTHASGCGGVTTMGQALAETYARDPKFYGATYCAVCMKHRPVDEFVWVDDGSLVGS